MATNPNAVFPPHNPTASFSFPKEEEKVSSRIQMSRDCQLTRDAQVLGFWKEIDAFQESVRQSIGKPQYSFYDGPPFATGLPHHGHILMGTVKVSFFFLFERALDGVGMGHSLRTICSGGVMVLDGVLSDACAAGKEGVRGHGAG